MGDRYTRIILTIIAACLIALTLRPLLAVRAAAADASDFLLKPGETPKPVEIPRGWGRFVGASGTGLQTQLWFEAADGTLRWASGACGRCDYIRK